MTLQLSTSEPFARGGNRLCFVHPDDPGHCIKVRRPDFTLADLRRKKGFPKNLRPLSWFDDNQEEYAAIALLAKIQGDDIFAHVYRCFGFVKTDIGLGLETELVRDANGQISLSLKQHLWEYGYTVECQQAVDQLTTFWLNRLVPSRDLLTHNILVQLRDDASIQRLVVVDGLGSKGLVPAQWWPPAWQRRKVRKRIVRFQLRIEEFVANCRRGKAPSTVGMLLHRDCAASSAEIAEQTGTKQAKAGHRWTAGP